MTDFLLGRIERGVNDFCRVHASTSRAESFLQRFAEKIRTGVGLAGALVKPEGDAPLGHRDRAMLVDDLNSRPPPPRKLPVPRESPAPVKGSCKASCNDASVLPVQVPKRILNPHSTTTAAETSVAAINTLSREATLIVPLHFPAPGSGLVDSLKHRQSAPHIRAKVGRRLWFVGHRSE
jgi:hypothetical protein